MKVDPNSIPSFWEVVGEVEDMSGVGAGWSVEPNPPQQPKAKPYMTEVEGYYFVGKGQPTCLDDDIINAEEYRYGVKTFDVRKIRFYPPLSDGASRFYGRYHQSPEVVGAMDTADGSLIPFFVTPEEKKKIRKLQTSKPRTNRSDTTITVRLSV